MTGSDSGSREWPLRHRPLLAVVAVAGTAALVTGYQLWGHPARSTAVRHMVVAGRVGPPTASHRPVHAVVGLGDSVPAGAACGCIDYVTLVGKALAAQQGTAVSVSNLATSGQTTTGLLQQLGDPSTQQALGQADLAIVTIGANDLDPAGVEKEQCAENGALTCYAAELTPLEIRLGQIATQVRSLLPPTGRVLMTGYWNVFLDGEVGAAKGPSYVTVTDVLTREVNAAIDTAATTAGARYVDLYTAFKGDGARDDTSLLAADGDHPSASGQQQIAAAVLAVL